MTVRVIPALTLMLLLQRHSHGGCNGEHNGKRYVEYSGEHGGAHSVEHNGEHNGEKR
jgi:hypothetical protein